MSDFSRRFQLNLLLVAVALLATACFRDTSEAIQNQPVAREYPSPTAVPDDEPTAVAPSATLELAATEPEATEPVADQFALTATALIARQTQPAVGGAPASESRNDWRRDTGRPGDANTAAPRHHPTRARLRS